MAGNFCDWPRLDQRIDVILSSEVKSTNRVAIVTHQVTLQASKISFRVCVMALILLRDFDEVRCRVKAAKRVYVFLDYDGTLTPIVSKPESATLNKSTRTICVLCPNCHHAGWR